MKKHRHLLRLLALTAITVTSLLASHNTSRYFPFLEFPSDYVTYRKTFFQPTLFFINASTADRRGGGHSGIPELWGKYNLKDVITSLQAVDPDADPIMEVTGSHALDGKSMVFSVTGKIAATGLSLQHEQNLGQGFAIGWWIPIMNVRSNNYFTFDAHESDDYYKNRQNEETLHKKILEADHIRRVTHQHIGFKGNEYSQVGFGDLDLHARWNKPFDHVLLMKSIDLNLQLGITAPTGIVPKVDYPSSVPAMGDGHWSLYGDIVSEFELKQDWRAGLMLGFTHQFSEKQIKRLAVGEEPTIFSALIGKVKIQPGFTFKFSPYFTLENLQDGLHIQGRYTYRRHAMDKWSDVRSNKTIPCFLSDSTLKHKKEYLSKWSSHYFTLQLTYDCATALKKLSLDPVFYATCDFPINGSGLCNTTEVVLGTKLHF